MRNLLVVMNILALSLSGWSSIGTYYGPISNAPVYAGGEVVNPQEIAGQKSNKGLKPLDRFCKIESTTRVQPNYQNKKVLHAAEKLSQVAENSFYFYGGPLIVYGLKKGYKEKNMNFEAPEGITWEANAFLVQLCGEFRDRPTLIEDKLTWIEHMYKLPAAKQPRLKPADGEPKLDLTKDIWSQMAAESYAPYLQFSKDLYAHKKRLGRKVLAEVQRKIGGDTSQIEVPAMPNSICETKYFISNYVAEGYGFGYTENGYNGGFWNEIYLPGYEKFKKDGNCTDHDLSYFYDFRGDSNFKHYSPESNAMIWKAVKEASRFCKGTPEVNAKKMAKINDQAGREILNPDSYCENYYNQPFLSRWKASRSGVSTWLFYSDQHEDTFSDDYAQVVIYPFTNNKLLGSDSNSTSVEVSPYGFAFNVDVGFEQIKYSPETDFNQGWITYISSPEVYEDGKIDFSKLSDLGFNKTFADNKVEVFKRLKHSFNRHTNWYQSGYDNMAGFSIKEAYSPFVASSYEMSESDAFSQCGLTIQCPEDGFKHWMLVFKVPVKNWYSTLNLSEIEIDTLTKNGLIGFEILKKSGMEKLDSRINFDTMWFDETTFGTTGLADKERAWDRLGTALEGEYAAILYLHNVAGGYGGQPKDDGRIEDKLIPDWAEGLDKNGQMVQGKVTGAVKSQISSNAFVGQEDVPVITPPTVPVKEVPQIQKEPTPKKPKYEVPGDPIGDSGVVSSDTNSDSDSNQKEIDVSEHPAYDFEF